MIMAKKLNCPYCQTDLYGRAENIDDEVSYNASEMGELESGSHDWERTLTCSCGHEIKISARVTTVFSVKKT